ncbi:hypothetical protein LOAG_12315, partial [Loa loa]
YRIDFTLKSSCYFLFFPHLESTLSPSSPSSSPSPSSSSSSSSSLLIGLFQISNVF